MRPFNVEKVKLQGKRHDNNTTPATKESSIFVEEMRCKYRRDMGLIVVFIHGPLDTECSCYGFSHRTPD